MHIRLFICFEVELVLERFGDSKESRAVFIGAVVVLPECRQYRLLRRSRLGLLSMAPLASTSRFFTQTSFFGGSLLRCGRSWPWGCRHLRKWIYSVHRAYRCDVVVVVVGPVWADWRTWEGWHCFDDCVSIVVVAILTRLLM